MSSSKGTAKLLKEVSLSSAAFRNSRRFKNKMSHVVVCPGAPYPEKDLASKKEPEAENGSDILAFCMLMLPSLT